MYRLLVVDSDKNSRENMVKILKNFSLDIAVQTVPSGMAAMEFTANNAIDILITEIRMEDIDGFSMVEELKQINENLKFIVVSASDEFEDAKKAIKLGATDYLHKPFDTKEFVESVSLALDQCEESKYLSEQNDINTEFVKEYVLFSLLYGKKISEIRVDGQEVDSSIEYDQYKRIILIEFEQEFFNKVSDVFEDDFSQYLSEKNIYAYYLNLNSLQSVILLEDKYCSKKSEVEILNDCNEIQKKLSVKYARKCFLALSSTIENCNELSIAMEEVEELMEGKFYESCSKVFVKTVKDESPIFVQTDDDSVIKQIKQDIKLKDIESLKKNFETLWNRYGNKTNLSQLYIKFVFSNILKEFYEALPSVGEVELNNEVDKLYRSTDLSSVKEIMNNNIIRMEENFSKNTQTVHREVECVKQYIYSHYKEEIGVEQLAEMVYMAPSYLSCVFKKETGQNLSKFIKSVRMENAKEMLENSHMKIVNISVEVGYPNVSYFCQSFREYYGISPQKFRTNGEVD